MHVLQEAVERNFLRQNNVRTECKNFGPQMTKLPLTLQVLMPADSTSICFLVT